MATTPGVSVASPRAARDRAHAIESHLSAALAEARGLDGELRKLGFGVIRHAVRFAVEAIDAAQWQWSAIAKALEQRAEKARADA